MPSPFEPAVPGRPRALVPRRARQLALRLACCAGMVLAAAHGAAWAAPFVPADDAQVVETLPRALPAAERAARDELRRHPAALPLALQMAREALARARRDGDPRELGQAQAALAPWWSQAAPPPGVRLLRATVRQSQHDFGPALADLEALQQEPAAPLPVQAQAGLTRAAILRVQGRYSEAAQACAALAAPRLQPLGPVVQWTAQVCSADLQGLRGDPQAAEARLAALARQADRLPGAGTLRGWVALIRAELADRAGDPRAQAHFQATLQSDPNAYTLAAYADWLLQQDRAAAVEPLLAGRTEADALLLRQAIAWRRLGDARGAAAAARLQVRFDAARQRGDRTHAREEALHALHLRRDAAASLALARANWERQREPADARVLWEAARAAGDRQAAEVVRRFQLETGLSDVRLDGHATPARLARAGS